MNDNKENNSSDKKIEELSQFQSHEANDFEFLQERIKERPINKKKLIQRTLITASMALLFGLVACLSFLFLEPILNNWLYPEEEPKIVTFPQEVDEMLPEDMLTEGNTTQVSTEETSGQVNSDKLKEDGQQQVQASETNQTDINLDNGEASENEESNTDEINTEETQMATEAEVISNYRVQHDELYNICQEVEKSMVRVTVLHSDVDWFNNTYHSEGTVTGVIIANNNKELLILAKKPMLDDLENIRVCFYNGVEADAYVKQLDANTELVVLAVDLKYLAAATLESITEVTIGSSIQSGLSGTPVIALGNLMGYNDDNICYGMIVSKENHITLADSQYNMINTDIYASSNPSGILVNLAGEVVGIIDNTYNNDETKNLISAIGISELKEMISTISNGKQLPYVGIYAQDVSNQAKNEYGIPQGAYIFDIDMDSPAMLKGIQKGDIIVKVGSQEIESAADYMNVVRKSYIDRNLDITVLRASGDEYEQMKFSIQPTVHPEVSSIMESNK